MSRFEKVEFRVSFSDLSQVLAAGFTEKEITKVSTSWIDPKTMEKLHEVKYFVIV